MIVAQKPEALLDVSTTYCAGCTHGVVHRLIAEIIDEFKIRERTVGITSIGCAIFIYRFLDIDYCEGAHGRAPAVATGFKRVQPDTIVFTYQGDGDIAAIGLGEIVHAASRNENFTVFFVNNGNYGMTGGQMAPTTLFGQVTTTTPQGRGPSQGVPIKICELLASLDAENYLARGTVTNPREVRVTKSYIKKGFERQMQGKGFSLIEVLGTCPTNWRMTPADALSFVEEKVAHVFPLGEIKIPVER
jgi:2-oxoglutarate/2-oxoacid ferredoxin oxidoreductase subunit beta